jgi:hypothetical protein
VDDDVFVNIDEFEMMGELKEMEIIEYYEERNK